MTPNLISVFKATIIDVEADVNDSDVQSSGTAFIESGTIYKCCFWDGGSTSWASQPTSGQRPAQHTAACVARTIRPLLETYSGGLVAYSLVLNIRHSLNDTPSTARMDSVTLPFLKMMRRGPD